MVFQKVHFTEEWYARVKETDFAWLAGMVEGDGSIFTATYADGRRLPAIQVANTDTGIVYRVAEILESQVRIQKPSLKSALFPQTRKALTISRVSGSRALVIIRRILPYMVGDKKAVAERVLKEFGG